MVLEPIPARRASFNVRASARGNPGVVATGAKYASVPSCIASNTARAATASAASQVLEEQPLLAGGKSANGMHAVGLARTALREGYAAGGQKRAHALDAGPAIHVRAIVPIDIERRERLA